MYGTVKHANKILEANKITDPTKLQPKMEIKIPPVE